MKSFEEMTDEERYEDFLEWQEMRMDERMRDPEERAAHERIQKLLRAICEEGKGEG